MSISREQVERVTNRMYKDAKQSGRDVSREQVRSEVVKRAQNQNNKKSK
jgi:hypothetical protein